MKIRFLFHNPKGERGVGKGIVAWTWFLGLWYNWKVLKFNFSHEECWLPDGDGRFWHNQIFPLNSIDPINPPILVPDEFIVPDRLLGQCFSSTTRGNANGVRFAPASEVLKHPERWSYIEVEVDEERLEVAMEEAKKLVGLKYDYLGLFGYFQPFIIQDKKRWYCSEILDWFKVMCRIYPKRERRVSPRRAAYILSKRWGSPVPLVKQA